MVLALGPFMGFCLGWRGVFSDRTPQDRLIRVLSYNCGEGRGHPDFILHFVESEKPDVIVMPEGRLRSAPNGCRPICWGAGISIGKGRIPSAATSRINRCSLGSSCSSCSASAPCDNNMLGTTTTSGRNPFVKRAAHSRHAAWGNVRVRGCGPVAVRKPPRSTRVWRRPIDVGRAGGLLLR